MPDQDLSSKMLKLKKFSVYEHFLENTEKILGAINKPDLNLMTFRQTLKQFVDTVITEISEHQALFLRMISYLEAGKPFISHSLNTAIITAALALNLKLDENKITTLVSAALLHDSGKLKYSPEIQKTFIFRQDDLAQTRKNHPLWGKRLLLYHLRLMDNIANLVGRHHEQLDGSGFPEGLSKKELLLEDNILITANLLENVLQKTRYSGLEPFCQAVELLMDKFPEKFEPSIKETLTNMLQLREGKRKFDRFKIFTSGFITPKGFTSPLSCYILDLSTGGIKISMNIPLPEAEFYRISANLSKTLFLADKSCRLIWKKKTPEKHEYGLEFFALDQSLMENVAKYFSTEFYHSQDKHEHK